MIQRNNIYTLTDFHQNAEEHIRRLKETGQPEILTDGETEIVIQDAQSYQRLLDALDRAEAIEGIRRGLESKARGEGRPADEVLEEIRRKHNIPPRSA